MQPQTPCFVCSRVDAQKTPLDIPDQNLIACPRCGKFIASGLFIRSKPYDLTPRQIGNISGWIKEQQFDKAVSLDEYTWDFLKSLDTPSVGEKAEKLLLHFARQSQMANQNVHFTGREDEKFASLCWAVSMEEFNYVFFEYLKGYKRFIQDNTERGPDDYVISPAGWDYIYSLRHANKGSRFGFCAMWFDTRLEPVWTDAIYPAIADAGYDPKRIDKHQHNNRIDDEIMVMIRRSRFVIADYTGNRGGVYFEAGFALGLGMPVIWTCRHGRLRNVHFDTRQYNFVTWEDNNLSDFKQRLQNRIETTIN